MGKGLKGRDLVSIDDFSDSEISETLELAEKMSSLSTSGTEVCKGKILATLFFEPSTRTRFSFQSAMLRLGGAAVGFSGEAGTSLIKGESVEDTVKMIEGYADVAVIRHSESGAVRKAADRVSIPVINGGEGKGEHPTQALLDLYTIKKELGRLDVNIGFYGDLKYGRTNHSLILGASRFGANFYCIAPPSLQMPEEYVRKAEAKGSKVELTQDILQVLDKLDVLYVTRLQKERLSAEDDYERLKKTYYVDSALLKRMKEKSIVMHPLPRVGEIAVEVDADSRAAYFRQAANGVPVRMALIALLLGVV